MSTHSICEKLADVTACIRAAAQEAGRDPAQIRLVAVSKTVDTDTVADAYACGHRDFGENRVQELVRKHGALPPDCRWHMIGHLQRNKVRQAVACACCIHSVDSVRLVQRLARTADEDGRHPDILLQINVSGEESKYGVPPERAPRLLEAALEAPSCPVRGLMTMAPFGASSARCRRIFADLRHLRDRLQEQFDVTLPDLSMGMSADFVEAVAEGATIVRVGTAVFG